ncbi:hypothetical protein E5329_07945 [Petralouisia muris]|uniref:Uncharacterized protein n=1 Tax=Petralouisia muris TaxID=3032872 RepID=A0AC61RZ66_9FIRM|nr:hypothetical protein [Petralouisia muris]TGY96918.1 hypothetical protein E5329_07945 [Petralouisia muris]
MKRKISMVLAVICLVLSMSTVSNAAANEDAVAHANAVGGVEGIQPYYVNTANVSAGIRIEGSTAYCYTEVVAKKACFINVIMRLQRKEGSSWHTVSSWIESAANAGGKSLYKSFSLSTKGTYRVYAICTVGGEEVTCASNTTTY